MRINRLKGQSLFMKSAFGVSVIINLLFLSQSAAQETLTNDTTLAVTHLSLNQIPESGRYTRQLISQAENFIAQNKDQGRISGEVEGMFMLLNEKLEILGDSSRPFNRYQLDKKERELELMNQQIDRWQQNTQKVNSGRLVHTAATDSMLVIWQHTYDSLNRSIIYFDSVGQSDTSLLDIKTDIQNFIGMLIEANNGLEENFADLKKLSTRITLLENKLVTLLNYLQYHRENLIQDIWVSESPPIWGVKSDKVAFVEEQEIFTTIKSNYNIIDVFWKNNPLLPYQLIVYFVLVLGTILYLKLKARKLYVDLGDKLDESKIVLQHPVLSSLIISWFGSLILTFFPKELNDLISILMLIPLIIILKKLNPAWRWYTIVLFCVSYLLFFFVLGFDYTYLPQRVILILINIIAMVVLLRMKSQVNITDHSGKLWKALLQLVIQVFLLLSVISLFANVLGSIRLAQLLIYSILGTIITLYTLKAAISLSESFVYLLLMGPLIKYSYILREDSELVLLKMDKLFRLVGFSALVIIILDLFNIRKDIYTATLSIINYPLEIGTLNISLGNILAFFVTLLLATWLSSLIRYILEKETFPRMKLKPGLPNTILLMIRFTFVLLGIVLAFSAAGIQMDKLTILVGALGVGIGFGLQNIINNFVSGIILALERPIKIGDKLEIPGVSGIVKDIGVRASTVRNWDGSDVVIPNGDLISNKLTNWTLYDRTRRIVVEIRVPFDTDMESLSKLLLDTAEGIPEVMKKPAPYLYFQGLGISAMEINLYCWISNNDNFISYGTSIRKAIFKALREAGYDIPLPKQDLKINPKIVTGD